MFTCSSCGYEANPDSAPACSLCGTKRPVKAGAKEAPAPKPAPAPASSSSSSSASASASSTKTKTETKRPSAPKGDELDELASAAQAVADSASNEPTLSSKGARSRPAAGENKAFVTTTGILRMSAPAPPIENALTVMGAFLGALVAYILQWHHLGGAPASFSDIGLPVLSAIVIGLVARLFVAPMLEESLRYNTKVTLHGPVASATGGALAIFALVGFFAASHAAPPAPGTEASSNATFDGTVLGQRLALMTPWTVTFKTDKLTVLSFTGKPELRIPSAPLSATDIENVLKATGYSRADLDLLMSADPSTRNPPGLPPTFSRDVFLDRIATVYGVRSDNPRPREQRTGTLLVRRRKAGQDELLSLPATVKAISDLQLALPQGVPLWIGVSLGVPHDSTSDHDAVTGAVYDQFRPTD